MSIITLQYIMGLCVFLLLLVPVKSTKKRGTLKKDERAISQIRAGTLSDRTNLWCRAPPKVVSLVWGFFESQARTKKWTTQDVGLQHSLEAFLGNLGKTKKPK